MPSRRSQIQMTEAEVEEFLRLPGQTMNVATIARDGRPHLVAMWYGFLDDKPAFWTFAKAQKVVNLRRDPRITCLVETGDKYNELRGVELVGTALLFDDDDTRLRLGRSLGARYPMGLADTTVATEGSDRIITKTAAKRIVVAIAVEKVVSWDHTKLAGRY